MVAFAGSLVAPAQCVTRSASDARRLEATVPARANAAVTRSSRLALRVHASADPGPGLVSFRAASPGGKKAVSSTSPTSPAPVTAQPSAPPAKGPSKARLPSLDSLRFFLIAYIAVGHFVAFATSDALALRLLTQVNVWVGAFFVLSGYVAGYTATEVAKFEASPRVKPAGAYTVARVAGFYPLYALVQLLFGAMFVYADNFYNGPLATAAHFLMTASLTQAWFPAHAEVWNAPTWFLSALTFAMLVLPHVLPAIAAMRAKGLRALLASLTAVSVIAKVAYSYDLGLWTALEGVMAAKAHPNLLLWNVTRFHPFYALLEVLMGVVACRMVMVQDVDDEGRPKPGADASQIGSAVLPAVGLVALTVARAAGWFPLNDPLTRGLLFVPLFTLLLQRLHRITLAGATGLTRVLGHPVLVYLGTISFPIFVVHGALGQLFYKKIIATKVWGAVMPPSFFPAYCAIVLVAAAALHHLFIENKTVQGITADISKRISAAL